MIYAQRCDDCSVKQVIIGQNFGGLLFQTIEVLMMDAWFKSNIIVAWPMIECSDDGHFKWENIYSVICALGILCIVGIMWYKQYSSMKADAAATSRVLHFVYGQMMAEADMMDASNIRQRAIPVKEDIAESLNPDPTFEEIAGAQLSTSG